MLYAPRPIAATLRCSYIHYIALSSIHYPNHCHKPLTLLALNQWLTHLTAAVKFLVKVAELTIRLTLAHKKFFLTDG